MELAMTILIGAVSVIATAVFFYLSSRSQGRIGQLIARITGLFEASQNVGILTAHENREKALSDEVSNTAPNKRSFYSRLEQEEKLIVVGSSLLGFKSYVAHPTEILVARTSVGLETRFLLTHPCFSAMREAQEGRKPGQIMKEIDETIDFLQGCDIDLDRDVRFYMGTPTCFLIITSEAMLLNPYPYQTEAYRCFCLEVARQPKNIFLHNRGNSKGLPVPPQVARRNEDEFCELMTDQRPYDFRVNKGTDIYSQYYWYHYVLPWFSSQSVTYPEYEEYCKDCKRHGSFDQAACRLLKEREKKGGKGRSARTRMAVGKERPEHPTQRRKTRTDRQRAPEKQEPDPG